MNNYEKLARVTVAVDAVAELYKMIMDSFDDCWTNLKEDDDFDDALARINSTAAEMRKELQELEELCHAE